MKKRSSALDSAEAPYRTASLESRTFSGRALFAVVILNALNLFDVFATIRIVSLGAKELNPLMALLLSQGIGVFCGVKLAIVGLVSGFALCFYDSSRKIRWIMDACVGVYFLLMLYHVFLIVISSEA